MRKNKEDRKEKKIRALHRELKEIGFHGRRSGEAEIVKEPAIIEDGNPENAAYARALRERFGSEDRPYRSRVWWEPDMRGRVSFLRISEEQYLRLPATLNPLYERRTETYAAGQHGRFNEEKFQNLREDHEVADSSAPGLGGKIRFTSRETVRYEEFSLKPEYRDGWYLRPGKKIYYFDPEVESRRQELKQRLEKIGGDNYPTVLRRYIYGPGHYTRERWGKDEQKLREEQLEEDMEEEIVRYCQDTGGLNETRHTKTGIHSYLEVGPECYDRYNFYQPGEYPDDYLSGLSHEEEMEILEEEARLLNEHRPGRAHVDLFEKLNGSAEKLIELKNKLS